MSDTPTSARRLPSPATIVLALAALVAAAALSYSLFFRNRGEAVATGNEVTANGAATAAHAQTEMARVEEMIARLMQRVRENPEDHEGWYLLGMSYRVLERLPEAAQAFRRAMELQPRNADYNGYLAEMLLIVATTANRPPPPEAEQLFRRTLEIQPGNPQARYYLATIRNERGDHRGAVDDLLALLRDAPAGESWPQQVRASVIAIAQRNNIDIAGRLPAAPAGPPATPAGTPPPQSTATAAIPGPTPEQLRQASSMTPTQQDAMGREMVDRLAARLRANPRDETRWIMLMRSRMVLNDAPGAGQALRSALGAFANDAATQGRLRQAARELGIPAG